MPAHHALFNIRIVLNLMRAYFHAHLKEALAMLGEMEKPRERAR
jgi:hypothetical protein